ncbi:MAG: PHP domain-containing protein [Syntrophomonadaceae bacterium]|jgi:predicted metal-dependent phosphoesterase TrpH
MLYDLHVHTTASDGFYSPPEVLQKADRLGLLGIAITDHDSVDGLTTARDYLNHSTLKVNFIPGIELNTEWCGEEIHILGYFIDYENSHLLTRLESLKNARLDRAKKILSKLKSMGINLAFSEVQRLAPGNLIGRPHIARAMMEKGYVFSIKEAFDKYISRGRPAYVARYKFVCTEAIDIIKKAGGIAVLAHPGLIRSKDVLDFVLQQDIDGIEVFYPEHTEEQVKRLTDLCAEKNLFITGGSDFHGQSGDRNRDRLGCCGINAAEMLKIFHYSNKKV